MSLCWPFGITVTALPLMQGAPSGERTGPSPPEPHRSERPHTPLHALIRDADLQPGLKFFSFSGSDFRTSAASPADMFPSDAGSGPRRLCVSMCSLTLRSADGKL